MRKTGRDALLRAVEEMGGWVELERAVGCRPNVLRNALTQRSRIGPRHALAVAYHTGVPLCSLMIDLDAPISRLQAIESGTRKPIAA